MMTFIDKKLSDLRASLQHIRREQVSRRNQSATAMQAVERVVDGTDGRIRLITGYRKKLQDVIGAALEYADELVNRIPGAIEVSSRTFATDPYVNAFFADTRDLRSIFSHSSEIREFIEDSTHWEISQFCALLCMQMSEKSVLGMELAGDMLKKDVLQVAVNFSDHRIYSPAPTEAETREGLKHCLFEGLVTNTLERIIRLRLENRRLQTQRQILQARMRESRYSLDRQENLASNGARDRGEMESARLQLRKMDELANASRAADPQASLDQVISVFSHPEDFVRLRKHSVRLNRMCIKVDDDDPRAGNTIDLTEVTIGNEAPRVIALAKFPRDELQSSRPGFPAKGLAAPLRHL
jgi:hypothetical protein